MKKNIFNKLRAAVATVGLIAAGLCAVGCNNDLLQTEDKIAYITPVLDTNSARTVFPTTAVTELKTISLSYTDTVTKVYAIWDTYEEFKDATIALETGTKYALTLEAFQGGAKYKASTIVTPVAGENVVNFEMNVVDYGTNSGSVELTAKFPKATAVKSNFVRLLKVDSDDYTSVFFEKNNVAVKSLEDGTQYVKLERDSVPAGIYKFEMSVTDTANKTGYVSDYVYIYEGCYSANAYTLDFADFYTIASGVYENSSDHVTVSPDTEGKGVKIVLKETGSAVWDWASISSSRTQVGMNINKEDYPSNGNTTTVYFPFGTDGEVDVFTLRLNLDTNGDGVVDSYLEEKVVSDSNGADTSLFNATATNVYNQAELKLSTNGSNLKLTKDIRTFLVQDKINRNYFDEVAIVLYVRGGRTDWSDNTEDAYSSWEHYAEWYEHASWSGSFSNKNYQNLLSEDGFDLYDAKALEKLANHKTWWANVNLSFRLKNGDVNFFTADITSEDTLYTPVKLNKYNFKLDTKDINDFSNSYEDGTKVTLPDFVSVNYKLIGWYDNKDFTGNPVDVVSAANNNGPKTFYGRVARVFNFNQWEDSTTHELSYNYMLQYDYSLVDTDVKKFADGDKIKITISGIPNYTIENDDLEVAFGFWDEKIVNSDGTKGNFGANTVFDWGKEVSFKKDQLSTCEIIITGKEYTVTDATTIWFFLPKDAYEGDELVQLENFKVKLEIVE